MPITVLPALDRTSLTFKADVDTFFGSQLPTFTTEVAALQTDVSAKQVTASNAATSATASAASATASKDAALVSQNAAAASANSAGTSAGTATTKASEASASAGTATTKAAEAAASAASVARDGSGGVAGLTLFKLNLRNAAGTITSWFTTAATAARTWTLPDKDGTVAMTSDITGTNSGTNTGDQTNITGSASTVTNAAQPSITSVGTLTNLVVAGTISTSGEITTSAIKEVSGHVGIGSTLPSYHSSRRVLSVGSAGVSQVNFGTEASEMLHNAYLDSAVAFRYTVDGPAAFVNFNNEVAGGFRWSLAPSGLTGAVATFAPKVDLTPAGLAVTGTLTATAINSTPVGGTTPAAGSFTSLSATTPIIHASYTVATVPSASAYARGTLFVSDAAGGAVPAFSDGTNWRRVDTSAILT